MACTFNSDESLSSTRSLSVSFLIRSSGKESHSQAGSANQALNWIIIGISYMPCWMSNSYLLNEIYVSIEFQSKLCKYRQAVHFHKTPFHPFVRN